MQRKRIFWFLILSLFFLSSCDFFNDESKVKFDEVEDLLELSFGKDGTYSLNTEDIDLPTSLKEVSLTWTSDKEDYLTNDGRVSRGENDVVVTLTVVLKYNDKDRILSYKVTIKGEEVVIDTTYTITFDSDGGSEEASITKKAGAVITKPNDPTKKGFIFLGWFENKVTNIDYLFTTMPNKNITLYARWIPLYIRDGDYIYFGEYPQTIKADNVTIDSTIDSRGYYLGSDEEYYAKVVANPHSDYQVKFSNDEIIERDSEYYFMVEPIKWRILSEDNGEALILCENIIEPKRFDEDSNNYKDSEIRAWLKNEFYNTAFNTFQQAIILMTEVDNSAESTGYEENQYACENTFDKLFLLSRLEARNTEFGFNESYIFDDDARRKAPTDYSLSKGIIQYSGFGYWWLRSPINDYSSYAFNVAIGGKVREYYVGNGYMNGNDSGAVPALKIKLV